jgi:hypothetical protein
VAEADLIICPQWGSQKKRFRGGGRYGVTPLHCAICATRVAVPLDIWRVWTVDHDRFKLLCEPCSLASQTDCARTDA